VVNKKNRCGLGWLVSGLAVCLAATSCRTCHDAMAEKVVAEKDLREIMQDGDLASDTSPLIQADVQIVAFRLKDIEKLQLAKNMTTKALLGLWKAGKAKLVATTSVVGAPDKEAVVKVTQEMVYPSEFNVQISESGGAHFNFRRAVWVPEPQNFTMRETGMVLGIIPKIEENARITLSLKPQWVAFDRWDGGFLPHLPFRQPVFSATSFEMKITIADGDTILLGGSSTPASDGKWVNVGFLTVHKK